MDLEEKQFDMGDCGQTHQNSTFYSDEKYMDPRSAGSCIPRGDCKITWSIQHYSV